MLLVIQLRPRLPSFLTFTDPKSGPAEWSTFIGWWWIQLQEPRQIHALRQILNHRVWFLNLGNWVHAREDLEWFWQQTWENQSRGIAQSNVLRQMNSLEVLCVTWCPAGADYRLSHDAVDERTLADVGMTCIEKETHRLILTPHLSFSCISEVVQDVTTYQLGQWSHSQYEAYCLRLRSSKIASRRLRI